MSKLDYPGHIPICTPQRSQLTDPSGFRLAVNPRIGEDEWEVRDNKWIINRNEEICTPQRSQLTALVKFATYNKEPLSAEVELVRDDEWTTNEESSSFKDIYASPVCTPSRRGFSHGCDPDELSLINKKEFPPREPTGFEVSVLRMDDPVETLRGSSLDWPHSRHIDPEYQERLKAARKADLTAEDYRLLAEEAELKSSFTEFPSKHF